MSEEERAKSYPNYYLLKPVKAQMLVSKVLDVEVVRTSKEFPEVLVRKGAANELRSKFVMPTLWERFMDELF